MLRFSANLGFLWTGLALEDRVRAAARAEFDAVEVHYPYDTPAAALRAVLAESGLTLVSLNTRTGAAGEFGLAAVPGAGDRARAAIDEAMDYAAAAGAGAVHVLAGIAKGPAAADAFRASLDHAARAAPERGVTVLIEPINRTDVPGYFLSDIEAAAAFAREAGVRVMLDCYHMAMTGVDPVAAYRTHRELIGHVQFADHPGRGGPGTGTLDLARVLPEIAAAGHGGFFGAEYRPEGSVEDGLGWLARFRAPQS